MEPGPAVPFLPPPSLLLLTAHDAVVRLEERRVHGEVRRRARVRLHVDAPLCRIQLKGCEGTGLAELFDVVDELVAAVCTGGSGGGVIASAAPISAPIQSAQ